MSFNCHECGGKPFASDGSLRKHRSITHGPNRQKSCDYCLGIFSANNFAKHVKLCSRPTTSKSVEKVPEVKECSVVLERLPVVEKRKSRSVLPPSPTVAELLKELELAMEKNLKVVNVPGKGRGVRALKEFKTGEWVVEYIGTLLGHKKGKEKEKKSRWELGFR